MRKISKKPGANSSQSTGSYTPDSKRQVIYNLALNTDRPIKEGKRADEDRVPD
jgi:hypothetical protein